MADFPVGLREVVPDQTVPEKTKEFIINTGKVFKDSPLNMKGAYFRDEQKNFVGTKKVYFYPLDFISAP